MYGEGATASAIEHRMRPIRRNAEAMRNEARGDTPTPAGRPRFRLVHGPRNSGNSATAAATNASDNTAGLTATTTATTTVTSDNDNSGGTTTIPASGQTTSAKTSAKKGTDKTGQKKVSTRNVFDGSDETHVCLENGEASTQGQSTTQGQITTQSQTPEVQAPVARRTATVLFPAWSNTQLTDPSVLNSEAPYLPTPSCMRSMPDSRGYQPNQGFTMGINNILNPYTEDEDEAYLYDNNNNL